MVLRTPDSEAGAAGLTAILEQPQEASLAFARNGQLLRAIVACKGLLKLEPGHTRTPRSLADQLRDDGRPDEALAVLERVIRSLPRGAEAAEAHVRAGTILLDDLHHPTTAYQHFAAALAMNPDPRTAALAEQGIAAIESMQKYRVGRPRGRRGGW